MNYRHYYGSIKGLLPGSIPSFPTISTSQKLRTLSVLAACVFSVGSVDEYELGCQLWLNEFDYVLIGGMM